MICIENITNVLTEDINLVKIVLESDLHFINEYEFNQDC